MLAVERIGLQAQPPGRHEGRFAIRNRCLVRHVDGLRDCPGQEGLGCRHHPDMTFGRKITLASRPAPIGAVEHRQVLRPQLRRSFNRHRAAAIGVGTRNIIGAEASASSMSKPGLASATALRPSCSMQKLSPQKPRIEGHPDIERGRQRGLDRRELVIRKTERAQSHVVDTRRISQRAFADDVVDDPARRALIVSKRAKRRADRLIDDLERATARQLLEFQQREFRLNPGRIAIHDEADRAGRGDHRSLGIAVPVTAAKIVRGVPRSDRPIEQPAIRAGRVIQRDRVTC